MDFNSLIHVAQKNDKSKSDAPRYYSTKFEPPKKEERNKKLSDNIKKFLAKKEEEEKQKAFEAQKKRDELLALRAKDKKATRRVNVMLKSTKSANKSAIQDAVDEDNTAVTLAGPMQPDEDDYGYVSQEASAFYNKMMEKYNNMPDEPKIFKDMKKKVNGNLNSTKDRVRAALLKEQEEAMLPHRRKRKSKHNEDDKDDSPPRKDDRDRDRDHRDRDDSRSEEKPLKPKPKPGPPPMNFADLLKLAEKKQFEPVKIEPKKNPEDVEHPMTKRQKRLAEEEKIQRERREERRKLIESGKLTNDSKGYETPKKIPKLNGQSSQNKTEKSSTESLQKSSSGFKIPSKSDDKKIDKNSDKVSSGSKLRAELEKTRDNPKPKVSSSNSSANQNISKEKSLKRPYDENKNIPKKDSNSSSKMLPPNNIKSRPSDIPNPKSKIPEKNNSFDSRKSSLPLSKDVQRSSSDGKRPSMDPKSKQLPSSNGVKARNGVNSDVRPKQFPPSDLKPKQFPPADLKPKKFPPSDLRPKQFPPSDLRPKQFPPADVRRKPQKGLVANKRRIIDDDDSEYDSEMDDFIDDDDEDMDYSKHISEIFGYDRNKYRRYDVEDDTDMMESSFSQMMKEEYISSKIGLMEDLEDMKQEALEKKKKAARMKAMMKR